MDTSNPSEEYSHKPTPSLEEHRIARVYGEALLNAAQEAGVVEDVKAELEELIQEVFRLQPRFEAFLASSAVGRNKKEEVLRSTFENRTSPLFFRMLLVLNNHDRLEILRALLIEFTDLYNRRHRRLPVKVRTAVPLSEEQRNRLNDNLRTGFQLEPLLEVEVDPEILGGMILRVGDLVMDASVRGKLEKIQKKLMARSSYEIQSGRDRFSYPG